MSNLTRDRRADLVIGLWELPNRPHVTAVPSTGAKLRHCPDPSGGDHRAVVPVVRVVQIPWRPGDVRPEPARTTRLSDRTALFLCGQRTARRDTLTSPADAVRPRPAAGAR